MKQTWIILVGIMMSCNSKISSVKKNNSIVITNSLQIIRIDSIGKAYLIYGKRNDSTFKIASEKIENKMNCTLLQIGKSYDLKLRSFLEGTSGKLHIAGIKFGDTTIRLNEKGIIWDLFYSENLKGLCYQIRTSD